MAVNNTYIACKKNKTSCYLIYNKLSAYGTQQIVCVCALQISQSQSTCCVPQIKAAICEILAIYIFKANLYLFK